MTKSEAALLSKLGFNVTGKHVECLHCRDIPQSQRGHSLWQVSGAHLTERQLAFFRDHLEKHKGIGTP